MISNIRRIGIGTAQFGLNYGISNQAGQVPPDEVVRILRGALSEGIDTLDTAALYGDSEVVLGDLIDTHSEFKIVTKTVGVDQDEVTNRELDRIERTIEKSFLRLKTTSVYGLIIHDVNDLFKARSERLIALLERLRDSGRVSKIGVSVYTGDQIDQVLERFTPDLVQLPGSIVDQRLVRTGHLDRLRELGTEIHMRSVFLQGLLLMTPDQLDPYFDPVKDHLSEFWSYLERQNISPLEASVRYALSLPEIDRVIVGICSRSELTEVAKAARGELPENFEAERWGLDDPTFVNPAEWRLIPELV